MIKGKLLIFTATMALTALLFSCTDKFEEYNQSKVGITKDELKYDYNEIGAYFPQIQQMIYMNYNWGDGNNWTYQIAQNLNADIFSGYMMTPTPFAGNENNATYAMVAGWNGSSWDYTYAHMMPAVLEVSKLAEDVEAYAHFGGVNNILKVLGMHRIANQYGPIIYSQYGKSATGGEYDKPEDTYKAFFADLKSGIAVLESFIAENDGAKPFERFDYMFGGDYKQWIKLANSLRLRLAIQIANVNPALAKTEAEAAVAHAGGLLESVAQVSGANYTHPLDAMSNGWGDMLMGGAIESIMTGYNDPRMAQYFVPASEPKAVAANITYKGIRQGILLTDKAIYSGHSKIKVNATTPAILFTAAEVSFLKSEGALRGWAMGGTAKEFYEEGITKSMDQWGASIGNYLENDNVAANFVDVINPGNNLPATNLVSPKWDEAATADVKQQKISTQKWLAMFPEGIQGWTEVRRTGYPKLLPVKINLSGGLIDTNIGVTRLPLPDSEKNNNTVEYNKAVGYLGGPDTGGTKMWWDVN